MDAHKDILVHIGFHKTATTWLQQELFISSSGIFELLESDELNFPKSFIRSEEGNILSPYDLNYKRLKDGLVLALSKVKNHDRRTLVISHERLSGHPHSSGTDSFAIARRIKNLLPNAKILIGIREQKSFILSIYYQYLEKGGVHSLKRYLNTIYDHKIPFFSRDHIKYDLVIKEYHKLFGKDNVLVLPYELFASTPHIYFSKLSDFIGRKIVVDDERILFRANTKEHKYVLFRFRWLNYFLYKNSLNNYSPLRNKIFFPAAKLLQKLCIKLTPKWLENKLLMKQQIYIDLCIKDKYKQSNRELSRLIDMDLSKLDYY